jgi:hypothetical protein
MSDIKDEAGPERPYEPPMLTFEGTLDELTLVPTFAVSCYENSCTPLS